MSLRHFSCLRLAALGAMFLWPAGSTADVIQWADSPPELRDLYKTPDDQTASFNVETTTNGVTFTLGHNHTDSGMASSSQWAIDRWPVAPEFHPSTGNYQIVTNADNDVVLGLYGFYGEDGFDGMTPPNEITLAEPGDSVGYTLSLEFATPVTDLDFQINAINALYKPEGFNSTDTLLIEAFLGDTPGTSPTYTSEGTGFARTGDLLEGDWFNQIGLDNGAPYAAAGQHVTDEGSVRLTFNDAIDRVDLTLTNTAQNLTDPFAAGFDNPDTAIEERLQTWAFSVGDLEFNTIPEPSTASLVLGGALFLISRRARMRQA